MPTEHRRVAEMIHAKMADMRAAGRASDAQLSGALQDTLKFRRR